MKFIPTILPDVVEIQPAVFSDERGFFLETYHQRQFSQAGLTAHFVQDNHSGSRQGIIRGLHYQITQPQGKLVRVVSGEIFDVAVDIRRSSPTFGKWVGAWLSAEKKNQIWIPPGFAHGFLVTSPWAEVVYKATDFYNPAGERTLLWNDPQIGITWPTIPGFAPILSPKDMNGFSLQNADIFD